MSFESARATDFRALHLEDLGLDEAFVNATTDYRYVPVFLYKRSENCDRCPFQRVGEVGQGVRETSLILGTKILTTLIRHHLFIGRY